MSKIEIPADVINRSAYLKYIAYSQHPVLKNRTIVTSEGEEFDIAILPHYLRDRIKHLSPKEQETIMAQKREYNSMLMKKNTYKAQAYGKIGRPKGSTNTKTDEQKRYDLLVADVVELFGRMFTINEVIRILGEDNGIQVEEATVKKILRDNIVEIERKREEFRNKVADVRLYNKRPRLEELAWMYSKMKMRYVALNSTEAYNAMLRTLEQLRKEAEGDILNVHGAIDMNLNVEINAHIQKEILKTINLKEIIIGRIAARMNYDPKKLIAGLHNSFYNKFVPISGDYDPNAEIEYPSLINYDFAEIERRNAERDDIVDVQAEPLEEYQEQKAKSVRELFLAKIRKQKEEMEQRSSAYTEDMTSIPVREDFEKVKRGKGRAKDSTPPSKTKKGVKKK